MNSCPKLAILLFCLYSAFPLFSQNECVIQQSLTVTATSLGSPADGPYQPGEEVTFCYSISQFEEINCNWLHGIVPVFGDGWDPCSFNSNGEPHLVPQPPLAHVNGAWSWFPDGWVRYNLNNPAKGLSAGSQVGAGWFFLNFAQPSLNPFDPNFTYGDSQDCSQTGDSWQVCFTLKANGIYDCVNGSDCSVTIHPYSDGETGAQSVAACLGDMGLSHQASVYCCGAPQMYPISDVYICNNSTTNVPLFSTDPMATFSWVALPTNVTGASGGTGSVIQQQLSLIDPTQPGSVIYLVTPDVNGCEGTPEEFEITLSDLQVDTGPDQYICAGNSVRLEASASGGLGPYNYEWSFGPRYAQPTVSPDVTTTYTLTVTDFFGCTGTDEVTVYVNQTGPITGATEACRDNFGTYYSIPPFPGAFNYTWTVPDGATIVSGQGSLIILVDWSNSEGGDICVTPNGACPNMIPTCLTVTTITPPVIDAIAGENLACNELEYTYEILNPDPFWNFTWTVTNGTIVSGQGTSVIDVVWNASGTGGLVEVMVSDPCGVSTQLLEIQLSPLPVGTDILGNDQICSGGVGIYYTLNSSNSTYTYSWFVPNGATIVNGQGSQFIEVDWGTADGGQVCLDIANNCTTISECFDVSLYDPVTVGVEGPESVCEGTVSMYTLANSVPLNADLNWTVPASATLLSDPTKGTITVRWDAPQGGDVCVQVIACQDTTSACLEVMANGATVSDTTVVLCEGHCFSYAGTDYCQSGQYTITTSSTNGCDDILHLDLTILTTPNIVADAGPDVQVGCTVDAELDGSGSSSGPDIVYEWTDENGMVWATTPIFSTGVAGTYILTVSDLTTLCVVSDTVLVSPAGPPTADAGDAPYLNCFNNFMAQLDGSGSASGSHIQYAWTGPNGFSSNEQNPIVGEVGTYCLEVIDNQTGCPSASACVEVLDGYTIMVSATQSFCDEADGTAEVTVDGIQAPEYSWSNGATTSLITDLAPGIYTVTVSSSLGACTDVGSVEVTADLSCKVLIAGNVYDDSGDQQCQVDASVLPLDGINLRLLPLDITTTTDVDGYYEFLVDTGNYTIEVTAPEPYFTKCPVDGLLHVSLLDTSDVSLDNHFFFDYLSNFDLRVSAISGPAQPGSNQYYEIVYCNDFFQTINGRIIFRHDPALIFDPVAAGATSYDPANYTATWKFYDLSFFECEFINFEMEVPASVAPGTILHSDVLGRPLLGDIQPNNNFYEWTSMVGSNTPPGIDGEAANFAPQSGIILQPNQPNPFTEQTQIGFFLPQSTSLELSVYDVNGRVLKRLEGVYEKGWHQWNLSGADLEAQGLLFYRLETEEGAIVRKMMKL